MHPSTPGPCRFPPARDRHGEMEVTWGGRVTSEPDFFYGTRTHATHERFNVHGDDGRDFTVIDNVALAPPVPVHCGDRVEVRGELVHDRGKLPLVHWTHHDPGGRHVDGYIEFKGRRYA